MISFREVGQEDAEIILKWRTSERVSKWMVTDVENDLQKQKQWLASCFNNPTYYHWMILVNNKPAGIINISNYSEVQKITSWGFYLGEIDFLGFGAFIPGYIYSFIFNRLLVNRIDVEIFDDNREVIDLHLLYGYQYAAKKCRVINKNGKKISLISMSLYKETWNSSRFRKMTQEIPVMNWAARPFFLSSC